MSPKAVVTGIGAVAPTGLGTEEFWAATLRGDLGIGAITRFDPSRYPVRLAGEVRNFNAADHLSGRIITQSDRMTQMALIASDWALADSGVDVDSRSDFEMSVATAASSGGFEFGQRELQKLWSLGNEYVSAYQSFAWFYAVNTGQISIRHGMRGPSGVVVTEQAGGIDAVAQARRLLGRGASMVLTGGVDSSLCPWGWVALLSDDRVSKSNDPKCDYLPFDARAGGYVPGEGGALLVLESGQSAHSRGALAYGEIAGTGATFDPGPDVAGEPGLRRAIEQALADADADPDDIDVVFADAVGVPGLDRIEAAAITAVFGAHRVPVTAPKTMTGRLSSGGAALDIAMAMLSIRDGVIPPTVNVTRAMEGQELDLVLARPRPAAVRAALILARGYGGFNSALVAKSVSDQP